MKPQMQACGGIFQRKSRIAEHQKDQIKCKDGEQNLVCGIFMLHERNPFRRYQGLFIYVYSGKYAIINTSGFFRLCPVFFRGIIRG